MTHPFFSHFRSLSEGIHAAGDGVNEIIPPGLVFEDEKDFLSWAREQLPSVTWKEPCFFPDSLPIHILSFTSSSDQLEDFLLDLLRTWLLPEKKLSIRSFRYSPFCLAGNPDTSFLLAEFHLLVDNRGDFEKIKAKLLLLSREITLYRDFPKHAKSLMKMRTPLLHEQEIYAYEALIALVQKWPGHFEADLFKDYERFQVLSEKEFKTHRTQRHQLRLVCFHYLLSKKLFRLVALSPDELHLELRLLPTRLHFPFGQKPVLGLAIAIHLPNLYESFEERHILLAAQKLSATVQLVKGSLLIFQKPQESLRFLYLELEKKDGAPFYLAERTLFKEHLKKELKKRVETLSPSVFGICDVEELMRNICLLGKELQYPFQIPHAMISFEGFSGNSLLFRVIVVRILKKGARPLAESFQSLKEPFEYVPERVTCVGHVGKAQKEATVFRLLIAKDPSLLRSDSSFNLYQAREHVLSLLTQAIGEVRDYNGGLLSKRAETWVEFKQLFPEISEKNPELLENFFRSLNPVEMQALIAPSLLAPLLTLCLEAASESKKDHVLKTHEEEDHLFIAIHMRDAHFKERLFQELDKRQLAEERVAWTTIKDQPHLTLGCIYSTSDPKRRELLQRTIEKLLTEWASATQKTQVLRLNVQHAPVSLDPRLGGDGISIEFLKMLFEGLMRIDEDGKARCAAAQSIEVSEDKLAYRFTLRPSRWNNGDPLTAQDFCYAWKKVLSPDFSTPFAYLFYMIRNAKKAKEGLISLDEIGVKALDEQTLLVELEHPCSYFLESLAHPLFSPVNHRIDQIHPNWPLNTEQAYVCNGPFQLQKARRYESYELSKNERYWDADQVQLDRIQIVRTNAKQAFEMFEKGETDWIGRPFRSWEHAFGQCKEEKMEHAPPHFTYWCVFNVKQPPFHSLKMRQALACALDRSAIIRLSSYPALPAFSPLPLVHTQYSPPLLEKTTTQAQALFREALEELSLTPHTLPPLILVHPNNELRKKIALIMAQQWNEILGITVRIENYYFADLFAQMTQGNYQIGMMSWEYLINDPTYTLNIFKHAAEKINFSKWEHTQYQTLLEAAELEGDCLKRQALLAKAETLLITETPVIPIFHELGPFIRKSHIQRLEPPPNNNFDVKQIYINNAVKTP